MAGNILVWDTETTGLTLHPDADVSKQPKMIEFGGILLSPANGSIVEEFEMLIDPGEPIEPIITKITGLTDADLKGQPSFLAALPRLRRLFTAARSMVAHNLPFDKAILAGELKRNGLQHFPWPPGEFCTVGMYREQWGRNPRLIELYPAVVGQPLAQEHRGLADVRALVEIIQKDELWRMM